MQIAELEKDWNCFGIRNFFNCKLQSLKLNIQLHWWGSASSGDHRGGRPRTACLSDRLSSIRPPYGTAENVLKAANKNWTIFSTFLVEFNWKFRELISILQAHSESQTNDSQLQFNLRWFEFWPGNWGPQFEDTKWFGSFKRLETIVKHL